MAYKYDFFLSYHQDFYQDWLENTLLPPLTWHLQAKIGYNPSIFIDRDGISTGETWPLRLKEALCQSKCLVSLLCPSYFSSDWCIIEFLTMKEREEENGFRTEKNPAGLILPLNISDGDYFPKFAKEIQYFDLRDYVIPGAGFKASLEYIKFYKKLERLAADIAKVLQKAPNWNGDWMDKTQINPPMIENFKIKAPYL